MASDWLTYDDFAGLLGDRFAVAGGPELELADAVQSEALGGPGPDGRQRRQFSLLFLGPVEQALEQATYPLVHPGLGELALFLVPLGPQGDRMRYEAAFA